MRGVTSTKQVCSLSVRYPRQFLALLLRRLECLLPEGAGFDQAVLISANGQYSQQFK
jgi:hypothetical protein